MEKQTDTLSIAMIVRNEEEMVEDALKSVQGADELVVTDTGSTDSTLDIVKRYTSNISHFKWCDDFSAAKNYALSKCTKSWVMFIDADCRLRSSVSDIRKAIANAKHDTVQVRLYAVNATHLLPKIFRRVPAHYFIGANQEYLAGVTQTDPSDIQIEYLSSPNHRIDPLRNMRILQKAVAKNPALTREKFYLAREFFYHRQYADAILWLNDYLQHGRVYAEIVEAMYLKAQCLWYSGKGTDARDACLKCIQWNPDCKKALLLMSQMHAEPWKSHWRKIAMQATNANVMFT